ncbi:MAG: amidohydrolase family protein [Gammaproteobacteria bacterium]|nr:amidohydrolase family protein [Gammaproteobacteria bacterium]
MNRKTEFILVIVLAAMHAASAQAQVTLTEGSNFAADAAADGRLAIDLLGTLWILPADGGAAVPIAANTLPARRPQWSPGDDALVYQARVNGRDQIWHYDFSENTAKNIGGTDYSDQQPSWHPDGERIVFSSNRRDSGFDLWELDLPTGLSWRISHQDGDETEPAWSADGRNLVYVHRQADSWSLILRRQGETERVLLSAPDRLSAPSWRPDGSIITFLRHDADKRSIDMVILSDPLLIRSLVTGEDFFLAPVSWLDREHLVYTANGLIRKRNFNSWTSSIIAFHATVGSAVTSPAAARPIRQLVPIEAPAERIVIRTGRMFDGIGGGYQNNIDIVIEGGKIVALEPVRDRSGEIVVDLGDVTALPGFIDSLAGLPAATTPAMGAMLLSHGVTTIVTEHPATAELDRSWSGKRTPGPRVLAAQDVAAADPEQPLPWLLTLSGDPATGNRFRDKVLAWQARGVPVVASSWQAALGSGAALLLGSGSLPISPGGNRYADSRLGDSTYPITVISGLAHMHTPGLSNLRTRQWSILPPASSQQRPADEYDLSAESFSVVLGSRPNGLPPGMATQAEFLALAAAGLDGEQVLRAAGVNAASALGLGLQLGRLAPGSLADLVIVDGDPLQRPADLAKVVGVVRNGRFYSAIGLIERAEETAGVE